MKVKTIMKMVILMCGESDENTIRMIVITSMIIP